MRRKLSGFLMGLGVVMILGAAGLLLYNRQESAREASFSAQVLPVLNQRIQQAREDYTTPPLEEDPLQPPREMTVVEEDGLPYVGILTIPTLEYQTPVLAETTDAYLDRGACRFYGSVFRGDLVICAHNYNRLYRDLASLHTGDEVWFTDMDGVTWTYEVAELETLGPNMVTEMTGSGYELTFFTCTYGGKARLTLRCAKT